MFLFIIDRVVIFICWKKKISKKIMKNSSDFEGFLNLKVYV